MWGIERVESGKELNLENYQRNYCENKSYEWRKIEIAQKKITFNLEGDLEDNSVHI